MLPFTAGVAVALSGVLIGWVMPSFFVRNMRPTPVNFPHLVERLTPPGISLVTASLGFLAEEKIRLTFSTLPLFIGMALFYTGILLNRKRNKERYCYPESFWLVLTAALLLGPAAGLLIGRAEAAILAGA